MEQLYSHPARFFYLGLVGCAVLLGVLFSARLQGIAPAAAPLTRDSVCLLAFPNLEPSKTTDWEALALSDAIFAGLSESKRLHMQRPEVVADFVRDQHIYPARELSQDQLQQLHQGLDSDRIILGSYADTTASVRFNVLAYGTRNNQQRIATPEPASLLMLGTGALGMCGIVRRRLHR